MPSIVVKNSPYMEVRENLKSGSIISFKINSRLEEELPIIINFIKSKGYKIENLNEHLST